MNDYTPFLEELTTTAEARQLVESIDVVVSHLFNKKFTIDELLANYLPYEHKMRITSLWSKQGISSQSVEAVAKWFEGLKVAIAQLPTVQIELGVQPSEALVKKVVQWVERTVRSKTLVQFVYKRSILAGAQVKYNGKYVDSSISR